MRNEKDWVEEVSSKSTLSGLSWQRMVQAIESYLRSVQGQEVVRLLFRLRMHSAGLLEEKKRCKMIIDERCVMYESGAGEDMEHFLVMWEI